MAEILDRIKTCIIAGKVDEEDEGFDGDMEGQPGVTELVEGAIEKGVAPAEILTDCLNPAMEQVGRLYEDGEYLIPDMLASAECVTAAMDLLEPHLVGEDVQTKGRFVIATVEGDLHDIGKNIVATLLRGSGFQVQDLGTNVAPQKILEAVEENDAQFVGLSALLTTTMGRMKETIEALAEAGLRDKVKVLIGGAPLSEEFAAEIGADHFCRDAFDAIRKLEADAQS